MSYNAALNVLFDYEQKHHSRDAKKRLVKCFCRIKEGLDPEECLAYYGIL